ncbi:DUF803-domain-containing protein [Panus rudis PR-1116 ss-1]|nr:DUF803-domain-containing protein [Panus rudis PR-1116 ss-1]
MSSTSASATATSSTAAAASSSAAATLKAPGNLKVVGIILAIASGVLIGSSFVFKKRGLLRAQAGGVAGEGVAYLKSALWWTGMIMMILGELCNFAAYAFVEAIVVTPMGALSVVVCAILSHYFLQEKLSFFGWLGCGLCIVGSVIIALNGPQEESIGQITEFQKLFLAPGFLTYGSVLIAAALVIVIYFAPRYGKKSMLWYILVCSMIGGISVSVTTGLGSAIVTTAMGDNQFKHWFIYFLMVFIAVTLITEVYYLNVALALFNTAMVTPTYYVIFTFFSIMTTIVLFKGLKAPVMQIITLVMGFVVICFGITILQLSKVDPTELKLDRRSTILLQAAKQPTEGMEEKHLSAIEDPGMDTLRGSFGTIGSIVRARTAKRMSMSSARAPSSVRSGRYSRQHDLEQHPLPNTSSTHNTGGGALFPGMKRHQLYDPPVPSPSFDAAAASDADSLRSQPSYIGSPRKQTIKFDSQDMVHSYPVPGRGDTRATHERRETKHDSHTVGFPSFLPSMHSAASTQTQVTLPPIDLSIPDAELRSAPPTLMTSPDEQFYRPLHVDPFANIPATSAGSFPSATATTSSATGSNITSPSDAATVDSPINHSLSNVGVGGGHRYRSSGSSSRHHQDLRHLFGRPSSSSPSKKYPRGDKNDDREESESLWHGSNTEEDDSDINGPEPSAVEAKTSIRLVPSSNNRI